MGKSKKRKRNRQLVALSDVTAAQLLGGGEHPLGGVLPENLATTIATLHALGARPELYFTRPFKELRGALYPLLKLQLQRFDPVDYGARVATALRSGRWQNALLGLKGMRAFGQAPKQGTVQRWVRDCQAAQSNVKAQLLSGILALNNAQGANKIQGSTEKDLASCLGELEGNASISIGATDDAGASGGAGQIATESGLPTRSRSVWSPEPSKHSADHSAAVVEGDASAAQSKEPDSLRVIYRERGEERQPANHYDLCIYACAPGWIRFPPASASTEALIRRQDVPGVPNAFVLSDVLTPSECAQIVSTAEAMGFSHDHPVGQESTTGIDTCEWLASPDLVGRIYARARPYLPEHVGGSGPLSGINARWRLFRYGEGAVYRPHIDGSWPGSGIDPSTGNYIQEHSMRSRLTFLVYLNDDFRGGSTTFYLPASDDNGGLDARGVQPLRGAVLCFPQGNTASLVHEGSEVSSGKKYVIRTDVLYRKSP